MQTLKSNIVIIVIRHFHIIPKHEQNIKICYKNKPITSQTFWMRRQLLKYQPAYILQLRLKLLNVKNYFEMLHFSDIYSENAEVQLK